jgi:hypothetical protein
MNLFNVKNRTTNKTLSFETQITSKDQAKKLRNALNMESGYNPDPKTEAGQKAIASGNQMPYLVTKGPLHRDFK